MIQNMLEGCLCGSFQNTNKKMSKSKHFMHFLNHFRRVLKLVIVNTELSSLWNGIE